MRLHGPWLIGHVVQLPNHTRMPENWAVSAAAWAVRAGPNMQPIVGLTAVMEKADAAMYDVKRSGKGRIRFYGKADVVALTM